jgi:N-terminal glutamine amidase
MFPTRRLLRSLNYLKLVKTPGLAAYLSPPPLYKPICGPLAAEEGVENNLMSHFVCMTSDGYYGRVLDRTEIEQWH